MSQGIDKAVLENIRLHNDIVEVVGLHVPLKRAGGTYRALCPFHKEKTPSFHVNPQRQTFHCFGCGAGGDVFSFVMQRESVDFITATRMLAERAGIRVEFSESDRRDGQEKDVLLRIHEEIAAEYHRLLIKSPEAEKARTYLRERELGDDLVRRWLVGYAPPGTGFAMQWGRQKGYTADQLLAAGLLGKDEEREDARAYYDRFRDRLLFPIRDELGRIVGFSGRLLDPEAKTAKYLNTPETILFKKSRLLFGLDLARPAISERQEALVCEGQIDVIRCHSAGIGWAIAPQGTALTEDHARILKRQTDAVLLVFDGDAAGIKAAVRSGEIFLGAEMTVRVASLPPGDDPDSMIRRDGPEAFLDCLGQARSIVEFMVDAVARTRDLGDERILRSTTKAVLEMILKAPSAVQQTVLLRQAAASLNLPEEVLQSDLQRMLSRGRRTLVGDGTTPPPDDMATLPPPMESDLLEILLEHPELIEETRHYLTPAFLTDPPCQRVLEALFETCDPGQALARLSGDQAGLRVAARAQARPKTRKLLEVTPRAALHDVILLIRRKSMENERAALRERIAQAPPERREALEAECHHLSMDIYVLRQGSTSTKWPRIPAGNSALQIIFGFLLTFPAGIHDIACPYSASERAGIMVQ